MLFSVSPEDVEDSLGALDELRKLLHELAAGVRLVGAERVPRSLDARAVARPGLGGPIARLDEQGEGRAAVGTEHGRGVRVVEARQVVEVAVLAERILGVGRADDRLRPDQEGERARPHRLQEAPPPLLVHGGRA
jgi:hypothetical protein